MRVLVGAALSIILGTAAFAGTITVQATDDIFYSDQTPPSGSGTTPGSIALGSNPVSIQFSSIAGSVSYNGVNFNNADGFATGTAFPNGTNFAGINNGLSGISYVGQAMFLIGVFTDGTVPSGASPANYLTYTSSNTGLASYTPGLDQLFFIGDGQGTGGAQTFFAPSGATNLYLGFADGIGFNTVPGAYADNAGSLTATFAVTSSAVPEPATWSFLGLGLVSLFALRKRGALGVRR